MGQKTSTQKSTSNTRVVILRQAAETLQLVSHGFINAGQARDFATKGAKAYGVGAKAFFDEIDAVVGGPPKDYFKKQVLVLITSEERLCGAVHTSIVKEARNILSNAGDKVIRVAIGDNSRAGLQRLSAKSIVVSGNEIGRAPPTFADVSIAAKAILDFGSNFETGSVISSRLNSMISVPSLLEILPLEASEANSTCDSVDADDLQSYAEYSLAHLIYYANVMDGASKIDEERPPGTVDGGGASTSASGDQKLTHSVQKSLTSEISDDGFNYCIALLASISKDSTEQQLRQTQQELTDGIRQLEQEILMQHNNFSQKINSTAAQASEAATSAGNNDDKEIENLKEAQKELKKKVDKLQDEFESIRKRQQELTETNSTLQTRLQTIQAELEETKLKLAETSAETASGWNDTDDWNSENQLEKVKQPLESEIFKRNETTEKPQEQVAQLQKEHIDSFETADLKARKEIVNNELKMTDDKLDTLRKGLGERHKNAFANLDAMKQDLQTSDGNSDEVSTTRDLAEVDERKGARLTTPSPQTDVESLFRTNQELAQTNARLQNEMDEIKELKTKIIEEKQQLEQHVKELEEQVAELMEQHETNPQQCQLLQSSVPIPPQDNSELEESQKEIKRLAAIEKTHNNRILALGDQNLELEKKVQKFEDEMMTVKQENAQNKAESSENWDSSAQNNDEGSKSEVERLLMEMEALQMHNEQLEQKVKELEMAIVKEQTGDDIKKDA